MEEMAGRKGRRKKNGVMEKEEGGVGRERNRKLGNSYLYISIYLYRYLYRDIDTDIHSSPRTNPL